jgi:hypothetical protein
MSPRGFLSEDDSVQRSDLVDISGVLRRETPLAYCLFDGVKEVWVPKSESEFDGRGTFTMPGWLARAKGLI